ncbi:MAG: 50S ribosomal protein L33 [Candidatus Omnitrophica bacterium]|nr:50S ribosomal protein L33 [Candidatus Omnitrophota bacterium]MDD5080721.1 50S ribosomal protein L33 [Candidatus Omnitrophota bacterium]MDD5440685.1 50S ribosomal protein L33 [Candidatus Omnitrophota bacterium]
MRELIALQCTGCTSKHKNYYITKNKKKHTEKMLLKKYCKFCRKHVEHKEVKP